MRAHPDGALRAIRYHAGPTRSPRVLLVRALFLQGRFAATALFALALAACAMMPEETPTDSSADAAHAEALYHQGEFDQAAAAFHALAESSSGDTAAHYHLRAA